MEQRPPDHLDDSTPKGGTHSLRARILARCASFVTNRPVLIIVLSMALAGLGTVLAGTMLQLDADTNSLISDDRPFMKTYRSFMNEFGDLEYLYVVVDAGQPADHEAAREAVRSLLAAMDADPEIPRSHGLITPDEQWRLAPRAMTTEELQGLANASGGFGPLLGGASPGAVLDAADAATARLFREGATLSNEEARLLGAESMFLLETLAAPPATPGAPWGRGPATPRTPDYLRSSTGRMYFIEVMPEKDYGSLAVIERPLAALREIIGSVRSQHPTVEIGVTGKPVLQADEMATTERDMTRASIIALAMISILFMLVFRGMRRPLLAVLAFAAAFGWTYGCATLLVGRLNLLSMVFMLVLVGVGIDYGVHVVARWRESRRRNEASAAVVEVMQTAAVGNMSGAVTSAGVFLLALLTGFQGLRELGLIAGVGLLLCMLSMMLLLPALLYLAERGRTPDLTATTAPSPPTGVRRPPSRGGTPILVLGVAAVVSTWFVFVVPERLEYESNLLALQAEDLESVRWEHRLFEDDTSSSWFAAGIVDTIESIPPMTTRARQEPEIGRITSVLDLVRMPTPERTRLQQRFLEGMSDLQPMTVEATPLDPKRLELTIARLRSLAALAEGRATEVEIRGMNELADRLTTHHEVLAGNDPEAATALRAAMERAITDAGSALNQMSIGLREGLRESLPSALRARFISPEGRFLVMLQPRENVWDHDSMRDFVAAIRRVDPEATGVPITQFESMNDMAAAFTIMAIGSILVVAIVLWIDFLSITATLFCLGTLAVGILWTLGMLALTSIPINLANFFAIPILIGLGADSSIHMMHRWREMQRTGEVRFGVTVRAVALTACTTAIGFGTLLTASHKGLQSLGWVMAIGSIACLLASVVVLPLALRCAPGRLARSMVRR